MLLLPSLPWVSGACAVRAAFHCESFETWEATTNELFALVVSWTDLSPDSATTAGSPLAVFESAMREPPTP